MKKILLFLIVTILLVGCVRQELDMSKEPFTDIPMEGSQEESIKVTDKGVKYLINPSKIIGGGPPKDGIPSIDEPKFVSVEDADEWIQDNELVLAIIYKDVKLDQDLFWAIVKGGDSYQAIKDYKDFGVKLDKKLALILIDSEDFDAVSLFDQFEGLDEEVAIRLLISTIRRCE